jgi:hypothetical protein
MVWVANNLGLGRGRLRDDCGRPLFLQGKLPDGAAGFPNPFSPFRSRSGALPKLPGAFLNLCGTVPNLPSPFPNASGAVRNDSAPFLNPFSPFRKGRGNFRDGPGNHKNSKIQQKHIKPMAKTSFMPKDESGRRVWLGNFSAKLPTDGPTVGVTADEITQTAADYLYFGYVCDARNQHTKTTHDWTAYKTALSKGTALGDMPTTPALGAPPPAVPPGIFTRASALAARIKKHPAYTEAIGQDLGIIGAEQVIDYNSLKPVLDVTIQAGHPNVGWTKQGTDGLELWVDRGTGTFAFLAFATVPDYLDTQVLPAPGASAVWRYKAIYRVADEQVGQWSDVVSISVMG